MVHDLSAILHINKIRNIFDRNFFIEDCKAIFLTADVKLHYFNQTEMYHKQSVRATVLEVILRNNLKKCFMVKEPKFKI